MEKAENKAVKSARQLLEERMSSRYPDRHFSAQNAQNAQNAQAVDDLDGAIIETLDEWEKNNNELREIFNTDPRSAEFINEWVRTKDPRAALVETFGDDLFEAGKSEEAKEQFKAQLADWRKRREAEEKAQAEYEANWNASLEALEKWGNDKGLSQDQKVAVMLKLINVAGNALCGNYSPEDFEMANDAINYSADVASAHDAGVVEGRNAKIAASRKTKNDVGKLPPAVTGQGARGAEPRPPRKPGFWEGVE